jgi:hypothetical protein
MNNLSQWANEVETINKHKFGNLWLVVNKVRTQAGGKYTVAGINTKDSAGNIIPREFRGKVLDAAGKFMHVILVLEATDKYGVAYQDVRDDLSFSDTIKIAKASLIDVFGPAFAEVFEKRGKIPVEVELVPTGQKTDAGKDKTTFKVVRQFHSDAERIAAEKEYFNQFGGNGATSAPSIPVQVETLARGLWDAVQKNRDIFLQFAQQQAEMAPYATQLADKFAAS